MVENEYPFQKENFLKIQQDRISRIKESAAADTAALCEQSLKNAGILCALELAAVALTAWAVPADVAPIVVAGGLGLLGASMGRHAANFAYNWKKERDYTKHRNAFSANKIALAERLDQLQAQGALAYIEAQNGTSRIPISPFGYPSATPNDEKLSLFAPRAPTATACKSLLEDEKYDNWHHADVIFIRLWEQVEFGSIKEDALPSLFLDKLIEKDLVRPSPSLAQSLAGRQAPQA